MQLRHIWRLLTSQTRRIRNRVLSSYRIDYRATDGSLPTLTGLSGRLSVWAPYSSGTRSGSVWHFLDDCCFAFSLAGKNAANVLRFLWSTPAGSLMGVGEVPGVHEFCRFFWKNSQHSLIQNRLLSQLLVTPA